ncbi:winged helix-turn-helix transcriptional regulator [Rhizobium glycinendophyticum]|uniref:Response regulator transcription factor n=1 Tax=Rhizobium glycinendophyticum TaxID=2589807 RepID=A0A504UGJ4_9HYPH|nr:response regulator transcription factor [Rhizobium glycinendophyticum]TPP04592.1 response regulator transcription factor [Rhizobium glycinendophyticum]
MSKLVTIYSQDPDFYMLMSHILGTAGFDALSANGLDAILAAPLKSVVAILVDTSDGIDRVARFCQEVKAHGLTSHLPIVALIPASHERNYLLLLKSGIDEGFMRPVSPERILFFLRTLGEPGKNPHVVASRLGDVSYFGDLEIDQQTRLLKSEHRSAHLSPIPFSLLRRLLKTPGHVVSRAELIEAAWPELTHVSARTVDVHIANLRREISAITRRATIRTVRSSGYALVRDELCS